MERRRPSLVGPLILITAGLLFLLANLGMLPYSFWEIGARFWPLILILVGVDLIIGRHSIVGSLIVVVLWIVLLGGIFFLSMNPAIGLLPTATLLPAATGVSDTLSQPLDDLKSATVVLNIGTARTNVHALNSDTSNLLQGTFQHAQGTRVVKTYDAVGSAGRLALSEEGVNFFLGGTSTSTWDVGLYPQVPLALQINGGVGRATLDLTDLQVTSLSVDSGVGTVDVTTPKSGIATVSLNGGVGSATVKIPQGVSARIRVSAGLGGINVDTARFPKFGDLYQSADYASASSKVDIQVDGGLGSIRIQ